MTRLLLLLPLLALAVLPLRTPHSGFDVDLSHLSEDAPNWLDELVLRND